MKLTRQTVDSLSCPPGRRDMLVFDDKLTGFCVRVTRSGAKIFLFQYHQGGRVRRLQLGRYGEVTPEAARREAEIARGQVRAGGHPVADRHAAREAAIAAEAQRQHQSEADRLTFAVLIGEWESRGLKDRREAYRREAVRLLRVNLPDLASRSAAAIDADTAAAELAKVERQRGNQVARQTHRVARAMFGWALKRRLAVTINPFAAVSLEGRTPSRDRVLSAAELGEVWRAAGVLDWPFGPYFRVLMLTLQRRREVAGMRWAEISPDLATWLLPAARAKNGRAQVVHLTEPVRAILRAMPRLGAAGLVFTTNGVRPVSGVSAAKRRLDAAIVAERAAAAHEAGSAPAPLVRWTGHDFRRSGVTALREMGVAHEVADRLLNHLTGKIQGVGLVYDRYALVRERELALEQWTAHVLAAAASKPEPPAVPAPAATGRSKKRKGTG